MCCHAGCSTVHNWKNSGSWRYGLLKYIWYLSNFTNCSSHYHKLKLRGLYATRYQPFVTGNISLGKDAIIYVLQMVLYPRASGIRLENILNLIFLKYLFGMFNHREFASHILFRPGYLEKFLVHPTRRQNCAGKLHLVLNNISDLILTT